MTGFIRQPRHANLITAAGTRKTLENMTTFPFKNLQNVAESSIKEKVSSHIAYVMKRYHTGKGDDFESVAAIVNNPNLPMYCGNIGFLQKGNTILETMMNCGGHFFTVNMNIPPTLPKLTINTGKGVNSVQLDYLIIDPRDPNLIKIYIIEFKAGSTQLVMGEAEEEQMVKACEIFKKWYPNKRFAFRLFYAPFLAYQPVLYQKSHTSLNVDYLTISGLSKILRIPVRDLQRIGNMRANFQENITQKLYKLKEAVIEKLAEEGVASTLLNAGVLSSKTWANFGIKAGNYGGFNNAPPSYKNVMSNVMRLMTSRNLLKKKYSDNPTNSNLSRLVTVTRNILNRHQRVPILTNSHEKNLKKFMNTVKNAYTHVAQPSGNDIWETFIQERKELLGNSQYEIAPLNTSTNYVPKKDAHIVELNMISKNASNAFRQDVFRNLLERLKNIKSKISRIKNSSEKIMKLKVVNKVVTNILNRKKTISGQRTARSEARIVNRNKPIGGQRTARPGTMKRKR
jgi:hypothetical protein